MWYSRALNLQTTTACVAWVDLELVVARLLDLVHRTEPCDEVNGLNDAVKRIENDFSKSAHLPVCASGMSTEFFEACC